MSVLGMTILLPIYLQGDTSTEMALETIGVSNILFSRDDMISVAIFLPFYSLLCYAFAYSIIRTSFKSYNEPDTTHRQVI